MKNIFHLYDTNIFVKVLCDSIALLVCASTAIFTITMVTFALVF